MTRLWPDTHPDAERILIEGYRRMSDGEKMRCMAELSILAKHLAAEDVRHRYPNANEREVQLRVASRWLDADLMRKAFNWDPDTEGY